MRKGKRREWKRSGRLNRHHIKNKCKGGGNEPENIILLDTERHKAFHFLFGNMSFVEAAMLLLRVDALKKATG